MKNSTLISGTVLAALAGAGLYYFLSIGMSTGIHYRFDNVTRGSISQTITATGTLQAVTTVTVGAQVSGIIKKINVDFNDRVRKNQIIALIDPTTLQEAVRVADATLEGAQAQYDESKRMFDRESVLLKDNLVSQAEYDSASAQVTSYKAALASATAEAKSARINLSYATIRSPIDGVVISRNVDVGQTVASSFSSPTLFTIANDLTKMQVLANVDEADIGRIQVGQNVTFSVDAYADRIFTGAVSQLRLDAVIVANVVNYIVVIDVPNNDKQLMPGMTANVTVMVARKDAVLKVPSVALKFQPSAEQIQNPGDSAAAVQASGTIKFTDPLAVARRLAARGIGRVWVLNQNNKLEAVQVHIGLTDGTFTEIASEKLTEGQQIVSGIVLKKGA